MESQAKQEGRCSLAAEALRSWGKLRLLARGLSMLPTLRPGDFLTVQSVSPEQIEPGEIMLYMREGRFFIHRVKGKRVAGGEAFFIARGDCMPEDDPPVRSSEVLGKIVEVQRAGSSFFPAHKLSPFRKTVAYMLCHWNLFRQVGLRIWTRRQPGDEQILTAFVAAAS
jgi:signal peptidase I